MCFLDASRPVCPPAGASGEESRALHVGEVVKAVFRARIMTFVAILITTVAVAGDAGRPDSYLLRVAKALELCRTDIPSMAPVADDAAKRLAAGGNLWVAGQPSMVSELGGRAGGLMMIRPLGDKHPGPDDVVLFVPEPDVALPGTLLDSGALVVAFGPGQGQGAPPTFPNHAEECGISPTLANAIPGWVFTGELVAALTRLGKMPVMYESIGIYGGTRRMEQYKNGEIAFHDDLSVPPVGPGVLGNRFVDAITAMLRRVEAEQRANLDRAGAWAREAKAQGKQLFMYSMGHLFPDEVGKTAIGGMFKSAVWNAGFRRSKPPEDDYAPGDVAVHIGYQHPPVHLLQRARPAGARVVYVAVHRERDYAEDPGVIWIDPMWDWVDACVTLEGYDIPILAASGIVNGAIAWEIYRAAR